MLFLNFTKNKNNNNYWMFRVKVLWIILCSAFNWVGGQTADSMAVSYQMSFLFDNSIK